VPASTKAFRTTKDVEAEPRAQRAFVGDYRDGEATAMALNKVGLGARWRYPAGLSPGAPFWSAPTPNRSSASQACFLKYPLSRAMKIPASLETPRYPPGWGGGA